MIKINLLPDIVLQRRKEARIKKLATIGLLGWAGFIAFIVVLVVSYNQYQKFSLQRTQENHDQIEARVNSPENVAFREEALAVQTSLDTLLELFSSRHSAAGFFGTLSASMPDTVRVTELSFNEEMSMSLVGMARSFEAVSVFEAALKQTGRDYEELIQDESVGPEQLPEGYFTGVELLSASISDENQIRFELRAIYRPVRTADVAGINGSEGETDGQ